MPSSRLFFFQPITFLQAFWRRCSWAASHWLGLCDLMPQIGLFLHSLYSPLAGFFWLGQFGLTCVVFPNAVLPCGVLLSLSLLIFCFIVLFIFFFFLFLLLFFSVSVFLSFSLSLSLSLACFLFLWMEDDTSKPPTFSNHLLGSMLARICVLFGQRFSTAAQRSLTFMNSKVG